MLLQNNKYIEMMMEVDSWCALRNFPPDMEHRVRSYLSQDFDVKKGMDEDSLLVKVPSRMRQDVLLHMNKHLLENVPLIKMMGDGVIHSLCQRLRQETCMRGEYVVLEGDMGHEMFFIREGIVQIVTKNAGVVATKASGEFFGEIALMQNTVRTASVRALTYCELMVLEREKLKEITKYYGEVDHILKECALQRKKETMKLNMQAQQDIDHGRDPSLIRNRSRRQAGRKRTKSFRLLKTTARIREAYEAFRHADSENDGELSYNEFRHLAEALVSVATGTCPGCRSRSRHRALARL